MKTTKFLLIAVIFFTAGFFVGQGYQLAGVDQTSFLEQDGQVSNMTMVFQFAENDVREIQNLTAAEGQTVLGLLGRIVEENSLEFKTQDYGELGILVTQIGDKANGQENKYWQYWVNDQQPQIGAGQYKLLGRERIEWKFAQDTFSQ